MSKRIRRNPAPQVFRFRLGDLNPDQINDLYRSFEASYDKATGTSWSKNTFLHRAENWVFYGVVDGAKTGVVAIRPQRSKLNKLVAIAGHPKSALAGVKALVGDKAKEPLWGAVSAEMLPMAKRMGLLTAHDQPGGVQFMRAVASMIPPEVFGGYDLELEPDGGITLEVVEVGRVTKYLVFNGPYLKALVQQAAFVLPALVPMLQSFAMNALFGDGVSNE